MKTIQLTISGKVQGVFYRQSAKRKAEALGIKGWILNQEDRSVLATVSGDENQLDEFVNWCRKGPLGARVDHVSVQNLPEESFEDFRIRK